MNLDMILYVPPDMPPGPNCYKKLNGVHCITDVNDSDKLVVIFYHGNADTSVNALELVKTFGHKYIIPEYPGYDHVPSHPSGTTAGINHDVDQLAKWIRSNKVKVHIIGQSIGTGPACKLACLVPRKLLKSLQLLSPFTSISDLANDYTWGFGGFFIDTHFDNIGCLAKIDGYCPINIYHGTKDDIIPVRHTEAIKSDIKCKVYIYEDTYHNDVIGKCLQTLKSFLD